MKKNVGKVDMIIRIIIALAIAVLGFVFKSWWGLLAIVPLITAFIKFCPLYTVFGCSTDSSNK